MCESRLAGNTSGALGSCQARHPRPQCLQLKASRQELSRLGSSGSRAPRQLAAKADGKSLSRRRRVSVGAVTWTLTSLLIQWPRQYFHTTCVRSGRSLATPQCRWGMDARAIRSETLCVFRGRFHPYRWKGQLAVSAEAGAPDLSW